MIVCETFGAKAETLEERNQDRRIGRREHGADEQPRRQRQAERERRDRARNERREHDPGHCEEREPDRDPAQDPGRQLQPAVEEDERHPERQQKLRSHRVEWNVDGVRDRRPEQHAREQKHEHPRNSREVGDELADEPDTEHDRDASGSRP